MAVVVQPSASLSLSFRDAACVFTPPPKHFATSRLALSNLVPTRASFVAGSPLSVIQTSYERKTICKAMPVSIKCEQSSQGGNSVDVWLGRLAMVGFASAITVEIATGKGLLENFGVTAPLPTVALAVTGLVGVLTAVFIFQSASKN
ncbi:stress enhanced protein 1, chloroplastic isoform X1 [Arachis ipaensis]|uniref:stress enhanced protein 1, chloroplastic isoform X1 n=1 Tax=Arachis ipaensis TaxID=130454 RepID=UPI0007AFA303|nr:stress enhanced protein 1, chloroplastic isoform X1 [Arachis ipaensis]XP_025674313.1 stress enhanced protein 1, chloroplastic isoform X1 [Arachis hypogaea]